MLEIKNLTFGYPGYDNIFDNFNLQLETDIVTGIYASSGYGKSTLGKIISGYIKPSSGDVLYKGQSIFCALGYRKIQLIYQHPEKSIDPLWRMEKVIGEGENVSEKTLELLGVKKQWQKIFQKN